MTMRLLIYKVFVLIICFHCSIGRNHTLTIHDDGRKFILLSSFGYLEKGTLDIEFTYLNADDNPKPYEELIHKIGFTLDKSTSPGTSSYVEQEEVTDGDCVINPKDPKKEIENSDLRAIMNFNQDQTKKFLDVEPGDDLVSISFFPKNESNTPVHGANDFSFSLSISFGNNNSGLYELYFHNCFTPIETESFKVTIVERNGDNFLSAGDMALPFMYGVMSTLFFLAGFYWISVLWTTSQKVFLIHHMMGVLVIIKALSIMFHSIDIYFISKDGKPEAWAIIFYVVHLLKGVLLFICLLLIGTGWAFIKYVLNDNEKKLFLIVIPLQILANIGYSIIEDKDQGNSSYYMWKYSMFLVELLCCGAILIPVIWSVRYLQEASRTDGKAAQNLAKLELFQHFYVIVICYLYFTRIIVKLLEITLPFQLIWVCKFFEEVGALVFFVLTGYKFRPGCNNPYLMLAQDADDEDETFAITQTGVTETITKVNQLEKDVRDTRETDALISTSV